MKARHILFMTALAGALLAACDSSERIPGYDTQRKWLSHRGVDLNHTVAGENSLEAVALAKTVGFESIETDVRTTSDGVLVCMHDKTLNRTCLNADGTKIAEPVEVSDVTLEELKTKYRLKADKEDMRTQVPTLTTDANIHRHAK